MFPSNPSTSLFQIPGPWLHISTASLASTEDLQPLVKKMHAHIPALSETTCLNIVTAVQEYGCTFFDNLGSLDKATTLKALNIGKAITSYGKLNSRLIPHIKSGLAVVLGLDLLFYCSDLSSRPPAPKSLERPQATDARFYDHFLGKNSWRAVLVKAHGIQVKVTEIAARLDPDLDGRSERVALRMAAYRSLNDTFEPGSAVEHNLIQVAFFLSALTKGYCRLGEDEVWEVALSDIQRDDPTVTIEEIKGIIKNPNPKGIIAAASVALSNIALFQLWTALGNAHRVDLHHPLGRIERILWNLIILAVTENTDVCEVAHLFFDNNEVKSVLGDSKNSDALDPFDYNSALCFPSDLLLSKPLQTIEAFDDEEVQEEDTVSPGTSNLARLLPNNVQGQQDPPSLVLLSSCSFASQGAAVHVRPSSPLPRTPTPSMFLDLPPRPSTTASATTVEDSAKAIEEPGRPANKRRKLDHAQIDGLPSVDVNTDQQEKGDEERRDNGHAGAHQNGGAGGDVDMDGSQPNNDGADHRPFQNGFQESVAADARSGVGGAGGGGESVLADVPADPSSSSPAVLPSDSVVRAGKGKGLVNPSTMKTRSSDLKATLRAPAEQTSEPPGAKSTAKSRKPRRSKPKPMVDTTDDVMPSGWVAYCDDSAPAREEVFGEVVDRSKLYALTTKKVEIEYYELQHPGTSEGTVRGKKQLFEHRAFKNSAEDLKHIQAIALSQPLIQGDTYYGHELVPLHVHPYAQRFSKSGKIIDDEGFPVMPDIIPDESTSSVFVVVEEVWLKLTGRQKQELLRRRLALVIHPTPPAGLLQFDADGMAEYTHPKRDAFVQDLGARQANAETQLKNGQPMDLVYFRKHRLAQEAAAESAGTGPPKEGQALNLLSNVVPEKTISTPAGWSQVATHEAACNYLRGVTRVPTFEFPWAETKWSIFANKRAMTWLHTDILFTVVMLPCGKKLWWVGRRKRGVTDGQGDARSRHALDCFNGNTSMTDVFDYELIHLNQYTTLFLPASIIHAVLSMDDSIGVGLHGVPISNSMNCVLTALHNCIAEKIHTNANHEIAREFLVKNFEFICSALVDPGNRVQAEHRKQEDDDDECLPRRIRDHLPDLESAEGILDVLALRSFVILYLALAPYAYDKMEKSTVGPYSALPVDNKVWADVMCAWSMAVDLDEHIKECYTFKPNRECDLKDFDAAADFAVMGMAASMSAYRMARKDLSLPEGFTPTKFTEQLGQMLGRFDIYKTARQAGEEEEECIAQRDASMSKTEFNKLGLVAGYHLLCRGDENPWLIEWDCATLPFTLTRKT